MKHTDPDALRSMIVGVIKASPLAIGFKDLTVEADRLDDVIDFLRIQVYMDDLDALGDDDVGALMTSIEETVTAHDDRVPSVRFSPP